MNKLTTLFALFLCFAFTQMMAQDARYLEQVFDEVEVTPDVVYGVNTTAILLPQLGEAVPQELLMDVYQPVGDDVEKRPLVLYYHTGNFLPVPQNGQINGTRRDSVNVEIATRLAKMGYVVGVCTYRQGWNPLAETQPERALGLIQAAYRGIQDARTAVRFFRRDGAEDNSYRVDSDRIVAWGQGTGGYITLGMATLDDYQEIVNTTNSPGKFLLDVNGTPLPMVIESINGDINGTSLGVVPPSGFPPFPGGDTLCIPNHVGYDSDIHMQVNMGGALGDLGWLDAGAPPLITFQAPGDFFAPYQDAVLIVPTTNDPIVQVQGGLTFMTKSVEVGNQQPFIDANIDDVYTQAAQSASAAAGHDYLEGLYPINRPLNSSGLPEGSPWEWWEPVIWDMVPHPSGGTFHTQGLLFNEGMSPEQGRMYIDTMLGYYAPRAYATLDLATLVSVEELVDAEEVQLSISPNPASEYVVFRSAAEEPMKSIQVFDLNGRLVKNYTNLNDNYYFLQQGDLPDGMYVAKVQFEQGILSKKVMFK